MGRRPLRAGPHPARHHRAVAARRAADAARRPGHHLQRRDLQLRRGARTSSQASATASAPIPTPRCCSPGGGNGGRGCCRALSACSRSRSGTPRRERSMRRATVSAKSRSSTPGMANVWRSVHRSMPARRCLAKRGRSIPRRCARCSRLRFVPEPWSIAQGVRKLPAGHWLKFDGQGLTVERWYDLAQEHRQISVAEGEAMSGLRERFDAAVAARLVSDVPVGVFLSSGIDSALVAASVAASGASLKTFTVGFEGASDYYEERPQAAAVARHLRAEHTEIGVSAAPGPRGSRSGIPGV